jgi:hypothetical protein
MELARENHLYKFQSEIFSSKNLKNIISKLEKTSNKKLTKNEINSFINYLKKFNYSKLYKDYFDNNNKIIDYNKLNDNFVNLYIKDISLSKSKFDIHEFLKSEIENNTQSTNINDYFGTYNNQERKVNNIATPTATQNSNINSNFTRKEEQIELTKILNWESLWRDSNVLIDSRYQNTVNQDRSRIVFNIVTNTKIKYPGSGAITSISNMRDIVEIEIYPFSIPYIAAADNFYQKITLSILELSAISIDAYEDSQFHFMFQSTLNGNLIDLTPINKTFRFFKPITQISEFSLRFGSPLNPILFDKDRLNTISINYNSNPGIVTFGEAHNLITGDLIYIDGFTTLTPAIDLNIINAINNPQGHICTRINNTSISINIDLTQIANASIIAGLSLNIYFGSKRIILPLKFRYLMGIAD